MLYRLLTTYILLLAFLACAVNTLAAPSDSRLSESTPAHALSSSDSANALFEDIVNKYATDSSPKGLYRCAEAYLKLCDIYYRCGYYTNAFSAATNALRIAESNGFNNLLPSIYNSIGTIYCTWRDFSLGTEYFKKGIEMCSPENDPGIYRSLIINIQGAYINMKNASLAKPYYDRMKEIAGNDSIISYFLALNNGLFLLDSGHPRKAADSLREAERLAIRHRLSPSMLASAYDFLGDCMKEADNDSSTFFWDKAVTTPGCPAYLRLTILKKLCDAFKKMGLREKAVHYGNRYIMLSDSIFEVGDINRMKDVQLAYENEKKMNRINELDADKKARDIKLSSQRRFIMAALCVILIFIVLLVFLYRQKRQLQQAYTDLFSRNKEAIEIQGKSQKKEQELRDKISSLEKALAECSQENPTTDSRPDTGNEDSSPLAENKPQSVDKLSDEKRDLILHSIEEILKQDDVICSPDFSIEMLAKLSGYNSRYVSHIVNEAYGCNFRALLNNRRMDIARERILDIGNYGNLTIQAIAESVGYKSNSGFVQLFKKHTGVTPSMFQKMAREQARLAQND